MAFIAMQNLIASSVNMADNIMLGSYNQIALSGAAIVNQLFFLIQFFANSLGEGIVVLGSQYWGKKQRSPIRHCVGFALQIGMIAGLLLLVFCIFQSKWLIGIFTENTLIKDEAQRYMRIMEFTFPVFIISTIFYAGLRTVGIVRIAFYNSVLSLIINVVCNYCLIYGRAGFPEMGVQGAAVGTLIARVVELGVVCFYCIRDHRLAVFSENIFVRKPALEKDFLRTDLPIIGAQFVWALSTPIQTAILGHLSSDAIAANSVATTFYQYLKVIVQAMCSAAAVSIGNAVGKGNLQYVREEGRSLSAIFVMMGILLGGSLYLLRLPLLSFYDLNTNALNLSDQLISIMSIVMIGMSYQMPVSSGIIRGGGDTRYGLVVNFVSTWLIVMPLSFAGAFFWHLSVVQVVILLQSDQVFKVLPAFYWYRSYRWIKKLA